jgi:hypothetical protein
MTTVIAPYGPGVSGGSIKSVDNWRAFIHQMAPIVVTTLVAINVMTEDLALQWIPFVFAIADNLLSVGNTADRLRRAIYSGATVLQSGGLLAVLLSHAAPQYIPIAGAIITIITAFLARFYTPTTTLVPATRIGSGVNDVMG